MPGRDRIDLLVPELTEAEQEDTWRAIYVDILRHYSWGMSESYRERIEAFIAETAG